MNKVKSHAEKYLSYMAKIKINEQKLDKFLTRLPARQISNIYQRIDDVKSTSSMPQILRLNHLTQRLYGIRKFHAAFDSRLPHSIMFDLQYRLTKWSFVYMMIKINWKTEVMIKTSCQQLDLPWIWPSSWGRFLGTVGYWFLQWNLHWRIRHQSAM